jgi:phage terminase large subunit-like protein
MGQDMIADTFHATLYGYIADVLEGRIAACKLVKAACQRHLSDLERQSTADFPFHFDESAAAKAVRFYPSIIRHSIGRFAGMPFELEPWQVFCTGMIFGWRCDADGTRRFRRTYRSVARKNGKSSWAAAEAIYMAGFDHNPIKGRVEPVAQVVLSATKRDQVNRVIFAEIERMIRRSECLDKRARSVNKEIRFAANDGLIMTTGSDRPYDGLNPHCCVIDELHAWKEHHRQFYDTMVTGSGFRDQPLISVITTAGDDKSYLWNEVYDYAAKVTKGIVPDERYFAYIAELDEGDDPLDERNWIKANPNLGVSVSLDFLRHTAVEASVSPIALNRFTLYHCNTKVTAIEQAFDMTDWDNCGGELSDWSDADVVTAAVDLGGRDDLAAYALCARFPMPDHDGKPVWRYEVKVRAYISTETQRDLRSEPFCTWIYNDILRKRQFVIPELRDALIEDCKTYNIKTVAYDPYNGQQISEELAQEGITAARMAQNCSNFNEPIQDMLRCIKERRFTHDNNPLLRWCANNAKIIRNRQDQWMYDKRDSAEKIDGIVAATMAFRLATLVQAKASGSLYLI